MNTIAIGDVTAISQRLDDQLNLIVTEVETDDMVVFLGD